MEADAEVSHIFGRRVIAMKIHTLAHHRLIDRTSLSIYEKDQIAGNALVNRANVVSIDLAEHAVPRDTTLISAECGASSANRCVMLAGVSSLLNLRNSPNFTKPRCTSR